MKKKLIDEVLVSASRTDRGACIHFSIFGKSLSDVEISSTQAKKLLSDLKNIMEDGDEREDKV